MMADIPPRVVILDDHITEYRIPLFRQIAQLPMRLTVLYGTRNLHASQRQVSMDLGFAFKILPGAILRLTRPPYGEPRNILINPTLTLELARLRPDVVVAYSFSIPTWAAFLYARVARKGFVSWSGDTLHTERNLGPMQRFARKLIIPRADACVALSHQAKEKYLSYGAPSHRVRVSVQGSGMVGDREAGTPVESETLLTGASREQCQILYVGALSERKGVRCLLDVFARVHSNRPDAKLVIAGDGPLRVFLENYVREHALAGAVMFTGYVQGFELAKLYRGSSLFLFPTLEDTFGVVLAEAAAWGLPIVSSRFAGGAEEFVREGENGYIVDPTDAQSVADAVLRILADLALQDEMGQKSLEIAASQRLSDAGNEFVEAIKLGLQDVA